MSVVRGCKQGKIENGTIKTGFDRQGESQQDNWLTSGIDFGVCGINSWRFGCLPAEYRERLALAKPGRVSPGNPESLWLGPDHWLIVSTSLAAQNIIEECSDALTDILYSAVDYSVGFAVLRVMGPGARQSLASGTGIDLRPRQFPEGTCWRTRLAQIPAVIVANSEDYFNVFVDRTYGPYMEDWLEDSSNILSTGTT